MPRPDYSTWITKQQAAAQIGVSTKTIEQMVKRRQLQQGTWRRAGKPALVMIHPEDVARVAEARASEASQAVVVAHGERQLAPVPARAHAVTARAHTIEVQHEPYIPWTEKLWLTVPEASVLSGLSRAFLERAIKAGELPALHDRSWKIRRVDLDKIAAPEKPENAPQH